MTFLPWKVMEWVNIIKEALLHWNTFKGVLFFSFLYFQCALCLFNLFSVKLQSNKLIHMFPPSAFLFFIYTLFFLRVFIFFCLFSSYVMKPKWLKTEDSTVNDSILEFFLFTLRQNNISEEFYPTFPNTTLKKLTCLLIILA